MKTVNKIFIWAFIILSLLPFFEFFTYQWRNDNRIAISSSNSNPVLQYPTSTSNGLVIYYIPDTISSFTDYVISEYHYGLIETNPTRVNMQGISRPIFLFSANILKLISSSSSTTNGPLLNDCIAFSLLIQRSILISISLFLLYILILPVLLVTFTFRRKNRS